MKKVINIEVIKSEVLNSISNMDIDSKVNYLNEIKKFIHEVSPFKSEPVDCVLWVKNDEIIANDYNPNKVAPPEMELLEISIMNDGYTQPIVAWDNVEKDKIEVIDGFHRNRVGKESKLINKRVMGYLPIVNIRTEQSNKNDRIASTIRHNRARGKHQVDAMSEIVIELKNRNWKNARIARELGMDEEEVLRLCQISGLEDLFSDNDFSNSWESSDTVMDYELISDEMNQDEIDKYRTSNTNDPNRIFHTYDKWECHKAGLYKSVKVGWTREQCEKEYFNVLTNLELFEEILNKIIVEWKYSCEHYLTNKAMNRLAWLGQVSVCYNSKVPSKYCGGWGLLNPEQQHKANLVALKVLNIWLVKNNREELDLNEACSIGRQSEIY